MVSSPQIYKLDNTVWISAPCKTEEVLTSSHPAMFHHRAGCPSVANVVSECCEADADLKATFWERITDYTVSDDHLRFGAGEGRTVATQVC